MEFSSKDLPLVIGAYIGATFGILIVVPTCLAAWPKQRPSSWIRWGWAYSWLRTE